jgi:GT2 family glycosyltransferase
LPVELDGMYSGLDLGGGTREFPAGGFPYGANMAFRRTVFAKVGGFATELGRQAGSLLSGEERELAHRLRGAGGRLVYVGAAQVGHHVLPDRTDRRWLLRRCFDQGRSIVVINQLERPRSLSYWIGRGTKQALRAATGGVRLAARAAARRRLDDRVMLQAARTTQAAGTALASIRQALAR